MPRRQPTVIAPRKTVEAPLNDTLTQFKDGASIQNALRVTDINQLTTSLKTLRNQWTVKNNEISSIKPEDGRFLVAKNYLEKSPVASEIFSAWELLSKQSIVHQHLALGVFSSLLTLLSTQYIYHSLGISVLRALLAPNPIRKLNAHLNSSQTDLVLVALKLWNAMAEFAGGTEKSRVYEIFMWGNKSLFRLYHMRRKGPIDLTIDPLVKPDIRTLFITFILQFTQPSTSHSVKSVFLESQRDTFLALFKRLGEDPFPLVRLILETCWSGIWNDQKLKRTTKISLFGEQTLAQLVKLYNRSNPETSDSESIPADLVHHFLLALCTHPGTGLCFKDRGWYPWKDEESLDYVDEGEEKPFALAKASKTYNRIIGNLLKNLKPTEDARQQELALKIFAACPELVSPYWSSSGLNLEPRLSSKWIVAVSWLSSIISLPVPTACFFLRNDPNKQEYNPVPPPLQFMIDNIFPSIWSKPLIAKGLQSNSALVQHTTAICLGQSLIKFKATCEALKAAEKSLEETSGMGQWNRSRKDLEAEIKRRVPNFEVIVAFCQRKMSSSDWGSDMTAESPQKRINVSMVAESALRLMWLYHDILPNIPAEARYDVGKLLTTGIGKQLVGFTPSSYNASNEIGFDTLSQLHLLQLLQRSDQFVWSNTSDESNQTHLYHLLHFYIAHQHPILSERCSNLLRTLLMDSALFEHDPQELQIWLDALPRSSRSPDAKGPEAEDLVDEKDTLVAILDKAVRECIKAPWHYLEATLIVYTGPDIKENGNGADKESALEGYSPSSAASPLLMALLELFAIMLRGELKLPSSSALSVATYLRQVIFGISLKQPDSLYSLRLVSRLERLRAVANHESHTQSILKAIDREIQLLRDAVMAMDNAPSSVNMELGEKATVSMFLQQVEALKPEDERKTSAAFELVDWVRFSDFSISMNAISRISALIEAWHPPALRELFFQINPKETSLASLLLNRKYLNLVGFVWAFLHCSAEDLRNESFLRNLADAVPTDSIHTLTLISTPLQRRLGSGEVRTIEEDDIIPSIKLWTMLFKRLGISEGRKALQRIVLDYPASLALLHVDISSENVNTALTSLIGAMFDPSDEDDLRLTRELCEYWVTKYCQSDEPHKETLSTSRWIPFMTSQEQLKILDLIIVSANLDALQSGSSPLLFIIIDHLGKLFDTGMVVELYQRMPRLLTLNIRSEHKSKIERFAFTCLSSSVPYGLLPPAQQLRPKSSRSWTKLIENHWATSRMDLSEDFLQALENLSFDSLDDLQLVSSLLYRNDQLRLRFSAYVQSLKTTRPNSFSALRILLDCSSKQDDYLPAINSHFASAITRSALTTLDIAERDISQTCLWRMIEICDREQLYAALKKQSNDIHHIQALPFLGALAKSDLLSPYIANTLLLNSLNHTISFLSDSYPKEDSDRLVMQAIGQLAKICRNLPAADVITLCNLCAREHLSQPEVNDALASIIRASSLRPADVNKLLQSILHQQDFEEIARTTTNRHTLIDLIDILFHLHPQNTCQPSHVTPLVLIYTGKLCSCDRKILRIFQLFEEQRKYSSASIISQWTPNFNLPRNGVVNAIVNLDPGLVFKVCTDYPQWRGLRNTPFKESMDSGQENLYDPVFLVLLLGQLVTTSVNGTKVTGLEWVQIFRSNIVCVLLGTLSARQDDLRLLAWHVFGGLLSIIKEADFHEKAQTLYTLEMLSPMYVSSGPATSTNSARIPTYTSLFFAHALRVIFNPSSNLYPSTSRFLLQRPQFDPGDVPMLYSMLYSSMVSDMGKKEVAWKRERVWILRFLADGMVSSKDWSVLKRRHTWDLLATVYQSSQGEPNTQRLVLNVLLKLSQHSRAAISLITRSNLLSWIEMQITLQNGQNSFRDFDAVWLQVIENVLISTSTESNHQYLEKATSGVWRDELLRSLDLLLRRIKCSEASAIDATLQKILIAARSLHRLSQTPYITTRLGLVLNCIADILKSVEDHLNLDIGFKPDHIQNQNPIIPIDQPQSHSANAFRMWLNVVFRCWLTMMQMKTSTQEGRDKADSNLFAILTSRMVALVPFCRTIANLHSNRFFDFETSNHGSVNNGTGNNLSRTEIQDIVEWVRNETLVMLRAP